MLKRTLPFALIFFLIISYKFGFSPELKIIIAILAITLIFYSVLDIWRLKNGRKKN